jgi:VWFA-related protein
MYRKAILALMLFAFPVLGQQPFQERVDVTAVLIDAVVTDSDGNQILGLGPEDFIVRENGVEQKVDSVDYFTSRRLLNAREENAPFKVERIKEERYLVFFFDKPAPGGELMPEIMRARTSVQKFVDEEMLPSDRIAIVGHDVRLKVYSDFTNDRNALRRALNDVARFGPGIMKAAAGADQPSILRNVDAGAMSGETGTAYQGLEVLAHSLRKIPARKNLIIFSPAMHEPSEEVRNGMILNPSRYLEPAIDALNAANVTAYAVNILTNQQPTEPMFHQSLERITSSTNGRYFRNATSFEPALEQIEKATSGYYLITYRPAQRKRDGAFQRVDVALRNTEFKVKARAGYLNE